MSTLNAIEASLIAETSGSTVLNTKIDSCVDFLLHKIRAAAEQGEYELVISSNKISYEIARPEVDEDPPELKLKKRDINALGSLFLNNVTCVGTMHREEFFNSVDRGLITKLRSLGYTTEFRKEFQWLGPPAQVNAMVIKWQK